MIPVAEALTRVLALAPESLPPEPVPLADAAGRVLAMDAVATRAQPPFAASAMDGYAVCDPIRQGQVFQVIGMAQAGAAWSGTIGPGQAARIFTGAPVPAGATRVIIQENTTTDGDRVTLTKPPGTGRHIRPLGADFAADHRLTAPRRLRPAELALLAAMNVARPMVARQPDVAFIPTGDELVVPGEEPGPDQIVASNIYALLAMARAEGARARLLPIARDTPEALADVLALAADADVIVTIGGASVGEHDLVASVAADAGLQRSFHKVAMRPGKPLIAGRLGSAALLGLPGNPVSAIISAQLFLLPLLRALQGLPDPAPQPLRARLSTALPANGERSHYMRATLTPGGGMPVITPFTDQDSGGLVVLAAADALLVRPPNQPALPEGVEVDYLPL